MTERENIAAGAEARRSVSGKAWRSDEPLRQEMLLRYLGTVATVSAKQAAARRPTAPESAPSGRVKESAEPVSDAESAPLLVRDVMDVPAASVHGDMPFLDIARSLTRENVGSLPVVDDDDRVMGVVSVSDLLAKAAVEASGYEPGAIGRLRERRLHDKARAETAEALMTTPAVTVFPGSTVAEATWLTSLSRLKRLPVTDHEGRLIGVVHRNALLNALIRDDGGIREEIESRILAEDFPAARNTVEVTVRNGVVDVSGRMVEADVPRLLAEIKEIDDVTEVTDHLNPVTG
ncbi:CBS domain-containing protein [Streptomyces sp. NBC_01242]|uniref:CBS domain-containing protein n=1 Tax=unclassified Streptomyces TaxID=2593676 RepID=UPI00225AED65|nr:MULTISPECIES: CBS domain-containing protein [unclassified Streptomyces]MCX4799087.1 CBS domain-containing protein [Streptomyces sp. NBC_01242]WSJ40285.1 CBS domain-containing protein [Streptomyces sp. NBC_01321]WSP53573.1 CBS domain-containing protein [Streptomyces sp. NBC_01241]WSU25760.1 CBS domain-containing protein [Streptomyces sp. NBC_01108]